MLSNNNDIQEFLNEKENERAQDNALLPLHWQQMQAMLHPQALPAKPVGGNGWLKMLLGGGGLAILALIIYLIASNKQPNNLAATTTIDSSKTQYSIIDSTSNNAQAVARIDSNASNSSATAGLQKTMPKRPFVEPTVVVSVVPSTRLPNGDDTPTQPTTYDSRALIDAFYAPMQKPLQSKTINNNSIQEWVLDEGTRILIPANAFVHSNGQPVVGELTLKAGEHFSIEALELVRMTTTSRGQQLETGGTLYLQATQNNQPLMLRKNLVVQIPAPVEQKNMELFYMDASQQKRDYSADWWQANQTGFWNFWKPRHLHFDLPQPMLTLTIAEGKFDYLETREGDTSAIRYLDGFPANYFHRGVFYIDDVLNKTTMRDSLLKRFPCLESISFRRFSKKWRSQYSAFLLHNTVKKRFEFSNSKQFRQKLKKQQATDSLTLPEAFANTDQQFYQLAQAYLQSNIQFSIGQLGWINCDRFANEKTVQDFVVTLKDSIQTDYCVATMVFPSIKSILPGAIVGPTKILFRNVPVGKKVQVIVVGNQKGNIVKGHAKLVTNQAHDAIPLNTTTQGEFRKMLQDLAVEK
jgi:hypothetical protein